MRRFLTVLVWLGVLCLSVAWVGAALDYPGSVYLAYGIPAMIFLAVGALLTTRVPYNLIGPTLIVGSSAFLIDDIGSAYAVASLERGPFPADYLAAWLGAWTAPLIVMMVGLLFGLFPEGRFTRGRRWLLPLLAVPSGLILLSAIRLWGLPIAILADFEALKVTDEYSLFRVIYTFSLWAFVVPASLSLIVRYRRSSTVVKQQTRVFLASLVAAPIVGFVGVRVFPQYEELVGAVAISLLPLGIAVAVLRYRLYDLGQIVSRTVSYALIVGVIALVFAFGVVFIPNQVMDSEAPPWLVAGSTLLAAASFNPLRRRVVSWVDRRFNRSHYDAERVMNEFAGSLRDRVDSDAVVNGWVGVVAETMQPSGMSVWVRE